MSASRRLRLRTRWWIGVRVSDLPPMTTLVALTLAGWADANGCGARPSLSSIARGCRLTRRAVVTHIKDLADAGWIRRSSGRGIPNRYSLVIPVEMEAKIETVLGEWTGEPDSLPGDEVGHLNAPSREAQSTKWGTPVPSSLIEPYKEPLTQDDLTPPWVALGITYSEWNRQGQPQPKERTEEERASEAGAEAAIDR